MSDVFSRLADFASGLRALLFVGAALAAFSEAEAQIPATVYIENDPKFRTAEPCATLGGTVRIVGNGEVCSGIDQSGTFCIVGSRDAFPCRGLYKHVVRCNAEFSRPAVNPFICGPKCDADGGKFPQGADCVHMCSSPVGTAEQCVRLFDISESNDVNCAQKLINRGHDVNERHEYESGFGQTPLHYMAENNACQIAALLIENGANVNAKDGFDNAPLHYAGYNDASAIAFLLIQNGADVNAKNNSNTTPLHEAARSNAPGVAVLLIDSGADVNAKDNDNQTPLHEAAESGYDAIEVASLLIANGANVNAKYLGGVTPLHGAAVYGAPETAALLINSGASVNAKDNDDRTPLHGAASGNATMVSLLINNGANVNAKDLDDTTPLHEAARSGATEAASILIANGADVDAKENAFDRTPLLEAVAAALSLEMASLLIANGADVNAKDAVDFTPLDYAISAGSTEIQDLLRQHGGRCNSEC